MVGLNLDKTLTEVTLRNSRPKGKSCIGFYYLFVVVGFFYTCTLSTRALGKMNDFRSRVIK